VRIVSLLPSVTEIVVALGLDDGLVGRTHECDFPPEAAGVPVLTASRIDHEPLDSAGIDAAVAGATAGEGLYALDEAALAEARPDLIVTQALCDVCAVDYDEVADAAARLPGRPRVLSLEPETLDDVLGTILTVGEACGVSATAEALVAGLRRRLDRVAEAVAGRPPVRVACLEWLDPPYAAGHWVPQQMALAGGDDVTGRPGRPSVRIRPEAVVAAAPEMLVLMPCGWNADQAAEAVDPAAFAAAYAATPAVREGRVVAVDGSSYFNRPGPRVVDGVELLASLMHPDVAPVPEPPGAARWLGPVGRGAS
jgi:iron complex transport system substrate-binding protein